MCSYEYALDHNHRSIGIKCPYPELYSRSEVRRTVGLEGLALDASLPLDSRGKCIFHSDDLEWKRKHGFAKRFSDLLLILDSVDKESRYLDFVEFIFIGEEPEEGKISGGRVFRIANHVFGREAKFAGARFLDCAEFDGVKFREGATFKWAKFERGLLMKESSFNGVLLDDMKIEKDASFEKIDFSNSYAIFGDTKFCGRVKFQKSRFEGLVDFSGTSFSPRSSLESVLFSDVKFEDFVNFGNATFNCQTKFERVSFCANAEFVDVDFKVIKSSYRYRGSAVEFVDIDVGKNGLLVFESTDPQNKIFKQDAMISFRGALEGVVRFENVNFHQLSDNSRKVLLQLSKLGKVDIGPGCIKYRLQTDVRTIEVEEGNQALTLEIAQTFARFFTAKNGRNLGLEILERKEGRVSFFYFSDEDLSEGEFLDMLKGTEEHLWEMLTVNAHEHHMLTVGLIEDGSQAKVENSVINAIDGVSALLGTFFRVGVRIAFGRWSAKDTRNLLDVVDFDGRQGRFDASSLHRVLLNKYTGRTLLDISTGQNQGLALLRRPIQNQDSMRQDSVRELAGDVIDVRPTKKKKILFLGANPPARGLDSNWTRRLPVSKLTWDARKSGI